MHDNPSKITINSILSKYLEHKDVLELVRHLKAVVHRPSQLCVFDSVRPHVLLEQQLEYDRIAPRSPDSTLRHITLYRNETEGIGFSVRGGYEHKTGLYVTVVKPGYPADVAGLRSGDEIIKINNLTLKQLIHENSTKLMLSHRDLKLSVRYVGMVPVKQQGDSEVKWDFADSKLKEDQPNTRLVRIYINLSQTSGLGCSICSGPPSSPGIFIQSVREAGVAQRAGLQVSDQIIKVNQISFVGISHLEAVNAMKGCKELYLTINQKAGTWLFEIQNNLHRDKLETTEPHYAPDYKTPVHGDKKKFTREDFEQFRIEQEEKCEELQRKIASTENLPTTSKDAPALEAKPHLLHDMSTQVSPGFSGERVPPFATSTRRSSSYTLSLSRDIQSVFTSDEIAGRQVEIVRIVKGDSFDIGIEGGVGSVLGGKIIVSEVFPGGTVSRQGGIHRGDQLLLVNGMSLLDITLNEAQQILDQTNKNSKSVVEFVVAKMPAKNYEDEM